jgi:hypothetical protein
MHHLIETSSTMPDFDQMNNSLEIERRGLIENIQDYSRPSAIAGPSIYHWIGLVPGSDRIWAPRHLNGGIL